MSKTLRLLTAIALTPICLVLVAMTFGLISGRGALPALTWDEAIGALLVATFGLVGVMLVGLPAYFILRRFDAANVWTAAFVGFVTPMVVFGIFGALVVGPQRALQNELSNWTDQPWKQVWETAYVGATGAAAGVIFWLIAPRTSLAKDSN